MGNQTKQYSFCETGVMPLPTWHLRELTSKGVMVGGGVDTLSLCGQQMLYDVDTPITALQLDGKTCVECRRLYK